MKPIDASWLASAIDGEGWIYFREKPTAQVVVGVCNTYRAYVEKASKLMETTITIQMHGGFGRKMVYRTLTKGHEKSLRTLNAILPFLIIKREKAEKAIEFIQSREWLGYGQKWRHMTPEQRSVQVKKSWITRRQRYGRSGDKK